MEAEKLLHQIAQIIFDKKGFNILALELSPLSTMGDCLIIAEGFVGRHLSAIAFNITDELKKKGVALIKTEESDSWIVLDYGQIMVHLFLPQTRERYQLEKLWSNGRVLPLEIDVNLASDTEASTVESV